MLLSRIQLVNRPGPQVKPVRGPKRSSTSEAGARPKGKSAGGSGTSERKKSDVRGARPKEDKSLDRRTGKKEGEKKEEIPKVNI